MSAASAPPPAGPPGSSAPDVPSLVNSSQLTGMERTLLRIVERANLSPTFKAAARKFQEVIGTKWVYASIKNLLHIDGMERMRALRPPGPTLLVVNHRSFFDQYVIACMLLKGTSVFKKIYSPVRSKFFYDNPAGLVVNAVISGLAMYPPFFREQERLELNRSSMQRLINLMQEPDTTIGFHPEGTRGKGPDPYELLPAQPGVGKLVLEGRPDLMVIPIFINGLSNDFVGQIRSNFNGQGKAISLIFGEPLDLSRFKGVKSRLTTQKKVADFLLDAIRQLGVRDRAFRAELGAKGINV